ncbi:hypothetical protein DBV15_12204 [Temnothorax longispinosus]|uniref:CCHC-type domain-containing protein n=1 Tax=Temnothorax longispinosus TaxID=300112 RepID=A0A4S2KEZ4_9HYME|nr:hypothetical protein DBV15_12204 [Temnothorax longispinosus]
MLEKLRMAPTVDLPERVLEAIRKVDKVCTTAKHLKGTDKKHLNDAAATVTAAITHLVSRMGGNDNQMARDVEIEELRVQISALREDNARLERAPQREDQMEVEVINNTPPRSPIRTREIYQKVIPESSEEEEENTIEKERKEKEAEELKRQKIFLEIAAEGMPPIHRPTVCGKKAMLEEAVSPQQLAQATQEDRLLSTLNAKIEGMFAKLANNLVARLGVKETNAPLVGQIPPRRLSHQSGATNAKSGKEGQKTGGKGESKGAKSASKPKPKPKSKPAPKPTFAEIARGKAAGNKTGAAGEKNSHPGNKKPAGGTTPALNKATKPADQSTDGNGIGGSGSGKGRLYVNPSSGWPHTVGHQRCNGLNTAWIKCPLAAHYVIQKDKKLQVGWFMVRVQALESRLLQCFKCLEGGHVRAQCTNAVDRSSQCYRCGEIDHLTRSCGATPNCPVCADKGRPAGHRAGGKTCTSARGKVKPRMAAGPVKSPQQVEV